MGKKSDHSKKTIASQHERKLLWQKIGLAATVVFIIGGVIGAVIVLRPDPNTVVIPEQQTADPARGGDQTAKVVVREYSDFQCPYCKLAATAAHTVIDSYAGKVRFEYNDFPLNQHQYSRTSAISAQCALRQDKFFEFHDLLFDRQTKWDSAESEDAAKKIFRGYAKEIGLDLTAYESCLTDSSITDAIQEDMDEGVALGVDSTPTFFVNNRRVDTSNGVEEGLRSAIDAELQAVGDNQSSAPTSSTNQPDVTNDNTAQ